MSTWLDRLSNNNASSGGAPPSRPYSPTSTPSSRNSLQIPSRSQQPVRPSLQTRSTSLNLVSSATLPASARIPRESSLKNQLAQSPSEDTIDPLEALGTILGVTSKEPEITIEAAFDEDQDDAAKPTVLAETIDFGSLSLEDFIEQNAPHHARRAHTYSLPSVDECMSSIARVVLHHTHAHLQMRMNDNGSKICTS